MVVQAKILKTGSIKTFMRHKQIWKSNQLGTKTNPQIYICVLSTLLSQKDIMPTQDLAKDHLLKEPPQISRMWWMVTGPYMYSALLLSYWPLKGLYDTSQHIHTHTHTHTHTHIHKLVAEATKCHLLNIHTEMLGSVSCPRILWHVDCRDQGSNQRPSVEWKSALSLSQTHPLITGGPHTARGSPDAGRRGRTPPTKLCRRNWTDFVASWWRRNGDEREWSPWRHLMALNAEML